MGLRIITPPQSEPVTADDVKTSARVDGAEFDAILQTIIPAARAAAEHETGRRLITQTVELTLDAFPALEIDLRLPDVQGVASVKYIAESGAQVTLPSSAYVLDADSMTGWLLPDAGTQWPAAMAGVANAVRVRYVVGFGAEAAAVPAAIRQWIIAQAVQMLQAPDALMAQTQRAAPYIDRLLDPYRIVRAA